MDKQAFGRWCEERAAQYLALSKGWELLEQRAHFREGELDLIFQKPSGELVFVEVKGVRTDLFGGVVERVTTEKVRRIKKAVWRWRTRQQCFLPGEILFVGVCVDAVGPLFEEIPLE